MWICVSPMNSQNLSTYIPGAEFPACEISQYDWNATVYAEKGYRQPFATPYANRVEGSDGNLVSKPVVTDTLQLFIGDIYRSTLYRFVRKVKVRWSPWPRPWCTGHILRRGNREPGIIFQKEIACGIHTQKKQQGRQKHCLFLLLWKCETLAR